MLGINFKNPINFKTPYSPNKVNMSYAPSAASGLTFAGKRSNTGKKTNANPDYDYFEKTIQSASKVISPESLYDSKGPIPSLLYNEAKYPHQNFRLFLEEYFGDMIANEKNPNRPISVIKTGIKSPESIKEKMRSKRIRSKQDALNEIEDIIRGRIILNTGLAKEGDEIVNRLIKAVKQGRVKIKEITHYRPDNKRERKELEYIQTSKLCELADVIRNMGQAIDTKGEEKKTGYLATHIIFELHNGYKGELQIMGANVERLKEVEDICFKIKCNKKVDPIFKDVVAAMKKVKADENLMNEYNLYTKEAYKYERLKALGKVEDEYGEFLRLDSKRLPKILDFNEIAALMESIKYRTLVNVSTDGLSVNGHRQT